MATIPKATTNAVSEFAADADRWRQMLICSAWQWARTVAMRCGSCPFPGILSGMKLALPDAEIKVFPNSSHMPFYEEPAAYYPALIDFLARRGASI